MWALRPLEDYIVERSRNLNVFVEFHTMSDMAEILRVIKEADIQIFDMDIHHGKEQIVQKPNAVLYLRMGRREQHHKIISMLSELDEVYAVKEL